MTEKKTSSATNALVWFGAAVSIAEVLTGSLLAPLGLAKGLAAILLGHAVGCVLLYLTGLIGARTGMSAMETVRRSFGHGGALFFAGLNVLQLIGWTAVMIAGAASAAGGVADIGGSWKWCFLIGAGILAWVFIGGKECGPLNYVVMGALFLLTIFLSLTVFRGTQGLTAGGDAISFGAAVELSAAMPISWLPLISDYTRRAEKPVAASLASSAAYFFTSSWMFLIGLGAALYAGGGDIAAIMAHAGSGAAALIIILLSTVTTTYLDALSAGISSTSISQKLREKPMAVIACIVGTLLAAFTPIERFQDFLYLIGSVFAPMAAIQIADYFVLRENFDEQYIEWPNLILWAVGFLLYRAFLSVDFPLGNTFPVMLIVFGLRVGIGALQRRKCRAS